MSSKKTLYLAFVVSGVAGLVYEVLWTRYLGLYVGHSAYAQVLVLAVYLGGMALGAMILADVSARLSDPVRWYAGAEAVLALFGLVFHAVFVAVSDFSYATLFPGLGSAQLVGAVRWGVAGLLILPQAMILGATFPLMAAAVVRADEANPGRGVARVYLLNTFGGAAGVLLAGFWMIGAFGLPGTSIAAALLNLIAASLAIAYGRRVAPSGGQLPATAQPPEAETEPSEIDGRTADSLDGARDPWKSSPPPRLAWVLLAVSFGTALASFAYEIGWIRMLSLVLGSATHSFELMLSAFILGLGLGAWWIRGRSDHSPHPLHMLGIIQVLMGLTAVLSVPVFYFMSFETMSWLVRTLPGQSGGYALFNLSRYGLCLLIMLPSTVLAGMTLPVITGTLLRSGAGEAAIGRVYGFNTIGSVAGAGLAGLVALPWLGLKGLILAGAGLDVILGLWLLERSAKWSKGDLRFTGVAAMATAVVLVAVGFGFRLDPNVMTSGVYREGLLPREGERVGIFYADGRTATVSAYIGTSDGLVVLATNGKPDASLEPRWRVPGRDTLPDTPIEAGRDFTTQVLAPAVGLAYRPGARNAAVIGHGSGMSATTLLTSEALERVVTIEIEPLMVEGSLVFLPANGPAIGDPRSSYVFDDAKSYFAYQRERFDIIFSEPSNPWMSGTASLFTEEFYRRAKDFLTEGGVLAQWMQVYELNDDLLLSVISALDRVFPSYRAYLIGDVDIAIVASADGPLDEPQWSVLGSERFNLVTESAPPFRAEHMTSLLLFDETTLRPLLDQGIRPNSDYRPLLDLGAERARFERTTAAGAYSLGTERVDLPRLLAGTTVDPLPYFPVPSHGLAPAVSWGRAAWLREVRAAGGGIAPEEFPVWQNSLVRLGTILAGNQEDMPIAGWERWATEFRGAEADLHWGTIGWVDTTFYTAVYDFLDRAEAPPEARAVVDLRHALSLQNWERAAAAADLLIPRVQIGQRWETTGTLLDISVLAYLRTGRPTAARNALTRLVPRTGRPSWHLRNRLLDALVTEAEVAAN